MQCRSSTASSSITTTDPALVARQRKRKLRRRRRLKLLLFALLFGTWFWKCDADFVAYFYDMYRQNVETLDVLQCGCKKKDLTNKTVWVVGASSGIGEAVTYELTRNNASKIIISGRRRRQLERVKTECERINPLCDIYIKELDVLHFVNNNTLVNNDDVNAYGLQFMKDLFQPQPQPQKDDNGNGNGNANEQASFPDSDIDILILNAGFLLKAWGAFTPVEQLKHTLHTNTVGLIAIAQSMIRYWYSIGAIKKHAPSEKRHQIVLTSSMTGKMGAPGYAAYSMSKHALHGFFGAMRIEHARNNIDFNVLCMGAVQPSPDTHGEHSDDKADAIRTERKYDEKFWNVLALDRMAQVYVSSVIGNFSESWIACQPMLLYLYANQYLSSVAPAATKIVAQQYLNDLPEMPLVL